MDRVFFAIGCLSGFMAVAFGACAAHGLKERLGPDLLAVFEVGVRYQMYHALALIAAGWACARWPGTEAVASGWRPTRSPRSRSARATRCTTRSRCWPSRGPPSDGLVR